MYNAFFGFREKPFKLVPNPDYHYLSKSHEIALAHLSYATDQGDGFVVITGEVGTGKTTLCRIFLERIGENTESAYIFNPKLNSIDLLSAICKEFGIEIKSHSINGLIDQLNEFLIEKNESNQKVILLIDEAQNLTMENLEMVRMLSNLETTRNKLIQIILVGQPELSEKLDSYKLRQLAQRISISCHLTPLTQKETGGYIHYRVNIAAQRDVSIFSSGACRKIYHQTKGTPRLINIAAERALLSAFSLNRRKVTSAIVQAALNDLSHRRSGNLSNYINSKVLLWASLSLALIFTVSFLVARHFGMHLTFDSKVSTIEEKLVDNTEDEQGNLESQTGSVEKSFKIPPQPLKKTDGVKSNNEKALIPETNAKLFHVNNSSPKKVVDRKIVALESYNSRINAVGTLLELWGQPRPNLHQLAGNTRDIVFFQSIAHVHGLRMYMVFNNWSRVKKINLPGIIELRQPNQPTPVYLAMVHWDEKKVFLAGKFLKQPIRTNWDDINQYVTGKVFLFWKNIIGFDAIISYGAHQDAVLSIKSLLRKIGYAPLTYDSNYDGGTRNAVMAFQERHKIGTDGLVGSLTKIMLINEAKVYDVPKLNVFERPGA
ncbi:MAG: AAA family ATPase [Desulfobacteraceae bacterium]|nr:AAA family ATPase [Desulfobacteraceae bacterium]